MKRLSSIASRPFLQMVRQATLVAAAITPGVVLITATARIADSYLGQWAVARDRAGWFHEGSTRLRVGSGTLNGLTPLPDLMDLRMDSSGEGYHLAFATVANRPVAGTGSIQAMEGYATSSHSTGVVPLALGTIGHAENTAAGTLTFARGVQGGAGNTGSGTVVKSAALFAEGGFKRGSGSIQNAYGVYVARQTVGDTNYAFFSEMPTADLGIRDAGVGTDGAGWIDVTIGGRPARIQAVFQDAAGQGNTSGK